MNVCVSVAMVTRSTKQQMIHNLVLAQRTYVPNMNFIGPQIAELDMIHDPQSIDPLILPTLYKLYFVRNKVQLITKNISRLIRVFDMLLFLCHPVSRSARRGGAKFGT